MTQLIEPPEEDAEGHILEPTTTAADRLPCDPAEHRAGPDTAILTRFDSVKVLLRDEAEPDRLLPSHGVCKNRHLIVASVFPISSTTLHGHTGASHHRTCADVLRPGSTVSQTPVLSANCSQAPSVHGRSHPPVSSLARVIRSRSRLSPRRGVARSRPIHCPPGLSTRRISVMAPAGFQSRYSTLALHTASTDSDET